MESDDDDDFSGWGPCGPGVMMPGREVRSPSPPAEASGSALPSKDPLLFCAADSAPLFTPWWPSTVGPAVQAAKAADSKKFAAAFLSASNYDKPEYFDIFVMAASALGFSASDCHHVTSANGRINVELVATRSALVLLGGGDTCSGWDSFVEHGLVDAIRRAFAGGAALVGIAAGAIQLGTFGYAMRSVASPFFMSADSGLPMSSPAPSSCPTPTYPTLGLAPYARRPLFTRRRLDLSGSSMAAGDSRRYIFASQPIGEEAQHGWQDFRSAISGLPKDSTIGIGLVDGSAVVVHTSDGTLEAYAAERARPPVVIVDGCDFAGPLPIGERVRLRRDSQGRVLTVPASMERAGL